jgi:catechol 2,3-dioxygenase-like lactoylglutathione lyase family enzyme
MLGDRDVTTLVAVKDLGEATPFYEKTLGLTKVGGDPGFVQFRSGASTLIVYESETAGTNKATTAAWHVEDVGETVRELKAKGVDSFQQYDNLPGVKRDGDIHAAGTFTIAWFEDPTGNIFEINNGVPA